MGVQFKMSDQKIDIWTESEKDYIERIPNRILCAINGLLAQEYALFSYRRIKRHSSPLARTETLYTARKYQVAFDPLDDQMILRKTPTEEELITLKAEYDPAVYGVPFNQYIDIMMLETIMELHYFACDSEETVNRLMDSASSLSYKKMVERIKCTMPICIDIADHDLLTITSNAPGRLSEIGAIVEKLVRSPHSYIC